MGRNGSQAITITITKEQLEKWLEASMENLVDGYWFWTGEVWDQFVKFMTKTKSNE